MRRIYQSINPFGEPRRFLTHYSGYVLAPKGELELYTMSSDASFVLVNGSMILDWPGEHAGSSNSKKVHAKSVPADGTPVKIDYYSAKGDAGPPEMVLG